MNDKTAHAWTSNVTHRGATVQHQLDQEERKFFKVAGRLLTPTKKAMLARQFVREIICMRRFYAKNHPPLGITPSDDFNRRNVIADGS